MAIKEKAPMILGIGAALAGILLLFRKKKPPSPDEPPDPPAGYAQLYGKVSDSNGPISMALVTLNGMTSHTTIAGDYLFVNLEPGEYNVLFSKNDYESQEKVVTLSEGNNELSVLLTLAIFTGFTLRLENAPAGLVSWNANFAESSFNGYTPFPDSGWLPVDSIWEYPSDPRGVTTLRVWALDADNNILFDVRNLGPVINGKHYIYDVATDSLKEAA